jgi:hypothetical protein
MGRSAVLSLLAHAAAIVFLLFVPETFMQPAHRPVQEPLVTPLVLPPLTLTQKEPNVNKTIREVRSPDLTPRISRARGGGAQVRGAASAAQSRAANAPPGTAQTGYRRQRKPQTDAARAAVAGPAAQIPAGV